MPMHRIRTGVSFIAILAIGATLLTAQQPSQEEMKEIQKLGAKLGELTRLSYDPRVAEQLKLTAEQKKTIQIATQKFQDEMMNRRSPSGGKRFDMEGYKELIEATTSAIEKSLSKEQIRQLTEMAKNRQATQKPMSQEQMTESQRLSSMMRELSRLTYDRQLAEELEITIEQKVDLREAQQRFQRAMQTLQSGNQGQAFDMNAYNQMMGDLMIDVQGILTPEQAERLTRLAKLKQLRQKHGDEFAMILGLAEEFELEPHETKKLRETIEEARNDYYERLKEMRGETVERIIRELPSKRRDEVRDALKRFLEEDPRKNQNPFGVIGN